MALFGVGSAVSSASLPLAPAPAHVAPFGADPRAGSARRAGRSRRARRDRRGDLPAHPRRRRVRLERRPRVEPRDHGRLRRARRQRRPHRRQLLRRPQRAHHRAVAALARSARRGRCSRSASAGTPTTRASAPSTSCARSRHRSHACGTDRIDVLYLDAPRPARRTSKRPWPPRNGSSSPARRGRSALSASPPRSSSRRASSPRPATRASPCSTCRSTCCAATSSTPTCDWSPALRAWRSRRRTRSSTASSPGATAPALRGGLSVRGAQIAANINRRGSRTLRALDAVGTELGVPDAAVAVAWLLAQKLVTAPIVNAYAAQHVEELVQGSACGSAAASWPTSHAPPSRRPGPGPGPSCRR